MLLWESGRRGGQPSCLNRRALLSYPDSNTAGMHVGRGGHGHNSSSIYHHYRLKERTYNLGEMRVESGEEEGREGGRRRMREGGRKEGSEEGKGG